MLLDECEVFSAVKDETSQEQVKLSVISLSDVLNQKGDCSPLVAKLVVVVDEEGEGFLLLEDAMLDAGLDLNRGEERSLLLDVGQYQEHRHRHVPPVVGSGYRDVRLRVGMVVVVHFRPADRLPAL